MKRWKHAVIVGTLGALWASQATAQTSNAARRGQQLSVQTPGVRSMGLGGASLAFGDDLSAAATNPAALTTLRKSEIVVEGLNTKTDVTVANANSSESETTQSQDGITDYSFIAGVYSHSDFSAALFASQPINYESEITADRHSEGGLEISRELAGKNELNIDSFGGAVAVKVTPDISLGLGVQFLGLDMSASAFETFTDSNGAETYSLRRDRNASSNRSLSATIGAKIVFADDFLLSGAYTKGASFRIVSEACRSLFNSVCIDQNTSSSDFLQKETSFSLPDTISVGLAWRASRNLKMAIQADRIEYSSLSENVALGELEFYTTTGDTTRIEASYPKASSFSTEDIFVPRAGIEYILRFSEESSMALRGGWFQEKGHQMEFDIDGVEDPNVQSRYTYLVNEFPDRGETQNHITAGVGLSFSGFQVELGVDHSKAELKIAAGIGYRF